MADYIKQSDIPTTDKLAEALGFDADGQWAKMVPAAPAEVQKLADGVTPGRVKGNNTPEPQATNLASIINQGAMFYAEGRGMPTAYRLNSFNFGLEVDEAFVQYGVPFILNGSMLQAESGTANYLSGWVKGSVTAIMMLSGGLCTAFDITRGEVWMRVIGPSGVWTKVGGNGYTLPVATGTRLGGVKIGTGLSAAADGTLSVPTATADTPGTVKPGNNTIVKGGALSVPLANADEETNAGVVAEVAIPLLGVAPENIYDYGAIMWRNGHGVPRCVKLAANTDIASGNLTGGVYGTVWMLDGFYANAWRSGNIKGFLIAANGSIVGFDTTEGEIWLKWGDSAWKQVSGGGAEITAGNGISINNGKVAIAANANLPGSPTANDLYDYTGTEPTNALVSQKVAAGMAVYMPYYQNNPSVFSKRNVLFVIQPSLTVNNQYLPGLTSGAFTRTLLISTGSSTAFTLILGSKKTFVFAGLDPTAVYEVRVYMTPSNTFACISGQSM